MNKPPNLWKANIYAFLVIFLVALSVAIYQARYMNKAFVQDARDHAKLAAKIIKINAQNALKAKSTSHEIVESFLKSQSRFIRYLENVEPFEPQEIWAFAKEAGLAGVTIVNGKRGTITESKENWLGADPDELCNKKSGLFINNSKRLFMYVSPWEKDKICIVTGVDATDILEIQKEIGPKNTLRQISTLSGVKYAKVVSEEEACRSKNGWGRPESCEHKKDTRLIQTKDGPVVQVEFPLWSHKILLLGMDASALMEKQKRIWEILLFFSVVLFVTGGLVTWVLFRHQKNYMEQIRTIEKKLFQKKQEASLGRSAATIAHEIRNPINAISMGIQRLLLSHDSLNESDKTLLMLMKKEIERTEEIVSGLLEYARPSRIEKTPLNLNETIKRALASTKARKGLRNISVKMNLEEQLNILGDKRLLHQLFENLFMNSLEAIEKGGNLWIESSSEDKVVHISVSNSGTIPNRADIPYLFEPYFTTKTKGTGLGLAICKKIVAAHKGSIEAKLKDNRLIVEVTLPKGT